MSLKSTVEKPKRTRKKKVEAELTSEHVADRAYFLWLEGQGRDDMERWLMAERELVGRAA